MRASRGEITIEEILKEAGLNFKEEYQFPESCDNELPCKDQPGTASYRRSEEYRCTIPCRE